MEESVPYSIRISQTDKDLWQQYADKYHKGNLARMIRSSVTFCMNIGDISQYAGPQNFQEETISEIVGPIKQVEAKIGNLTNDMTIIKSLISQMIKQKIPAIPISGPEKDIVSLEEIVEERVYDYLQTADKKVNTQELLDYLKDSCADCRRYFAKAEREFDGGAFFNLLSIQERVMKQLYEKTGNEIYQLNGGSDFDF